MQNKYWERPILLYLLTYQHRIEHFTKRYKYPSDIYSHFIKMHLGIQNKYIIFLHILLSPFRIFVVLFYFTFKFFKTLGIYICRSKKIFEGKELYLLFDTLIIDRSKGTNLFNQSKSWLLAPGIKKSEELKGKEEYTVFDFIKTSDIFFTYGCAILSFFILWRKYNYRLTIYHYCSFDFFLVYCSLNNLPEDVSIYFSTQIDRWALLFDQSKQINKILVQHGIESPQAFWRYRFSNIQTVYSISENEAQHLIHACFKSYPKNIFYIKPTLMLTRVHSAYGFNVLIISYSMVYLAQECKLIMELSKLDIGIYLKIHPTLDGSVFSPLRKQCSFEIVEGKVFPDVNAVISYSSTLAKEYEQMGKIVLYHTEEGVNSVIKKVEGLKNEN